MSKYVRYYNDRQTALRMLADQFLNWVASEELKPEQTQNFTKFFTKVAKRFGLLTEFRIRGII